MNTEEIFEKIRTDLDVIKVTPIIRDQYFQLEGFIKKQKVNIIHSFTQIKRNQQFSGLISETMFFDDKYIYDIVVGVDNIDTHVVLLKHVSKVRVATIPSYVNEKKADGSNSKRVEFNSELNISYQDQTQLYYQTPPEKYNELLVIADILTKMIGK